MKNKRRSLTTQLYETAQIRTAEQTHECLQAIHAGHQAKEQLEQTQERPEDAEALRRTVERCRQQLAVAYLPLLTRICKRYWYRSYTLPIDDLIQEGTIGMLEAIDKYDGAPLNFAAVITQKVKDALCQIIKQSRVVRYPPPVASALRKIRYVSECLTKWIGHWPQPEEIAEEMAIPSAITHTLLSYCQFSVSLDRRRKG